MARLRLLIASKDEEAENIAMRLRLDGFEVAEAATADEVMSLLKFQPDLNMAILDLSLPPLDAFGIYKQLHKKAPIPTLMLMARDRYQKLGGHDPHQGEYDDYLVKPFKLEELVLRVKALLLRAGYELPSPEEAKTEQPVKRHTQKGGKVYCVFSAKGGVGKTTIAANLAVALAKSDSEKVLLFDGNLSFGDVGELLNIPQSRSIFDAMPAVETVDTEVLENIMFDHPSGIKVILAPPRPVLAERIPSALITRVLSLSRIMFNRVIVDTHSSYDEKNLDILDAADYILLILTPEIGAVKNTVHFLAMAEELGYKDKVLAVLNRSKSGIKVDEIEKGLGIPVFASVVSQGRFIVESGNQGEPFLLRSKGEQASQDIVRLASSLVRLDAVSQKAVQEKESKPRILGLPWLKRARA